MTEPASADPTITELLATARAVVGGAALPKKDAAAFMAAFIRLAESDDPAAPDAPTGDPRVELVRAACARALPRVYFDLEAHGRDGLFVTVSGAYNKDQTLSIICEMLDVLLVVA